MPEAVRIIGTVADFDGAEVRVGVDYGTVTLWAPQPGGNRFATNQFGKLMELLQKAYGDSGRLMWEEAEDVGEEEIDEDPEPPMTKQQSEDALAAAENATWD